MEYVLLIVGFVLLIKGADFFVDGSSAIARLFKVPSIIIGLTVVALGTSLPEAAVSISASIAGSNSLAISNVLGSNLFNLLIVLGMSALLCPVKAEPVAYKREIPLTIGATLLLGILLLVNTVFPAGSEGLGVFERLFASETTFTLSRIGGAILLVVFITYLVIQVLSALASRKRGEVKDEEDQKKLPLWASLLFIVGGAAAIVIGGDFVVDSATKIAKTFGMSEELIGLTIVAFGTSLPELVTSIVAANKGESDLALGNVVGSNMFNIVFILGSSAVFSPITVAISSIIDIVILTVVSAIVMVFAATKKKVSRVEGATMLAIYAGYFVYILLR